MSFCNDVKSELAALKTPRCCRTALTYGFMLFSRYFGIERIAMQTSNESTARLYCEMIKWVYGVEPVLNTGGSRRVTYTAGVSDRTDRLRILASVDYGMTDTAINSGVFSRECCPAAFIRGVFFACGAVSSPETEYRAEFRIRDVRLADELAALLKAHGILTLRTVRAGLEIVYIRESGMVEDLLTLIGASNRSLEMMDTKIIKSVKNNMNRASNCDSANISKTVEASIAQRTAIEYLAATDRLESLPPELLAAALLRRDNPDSSLKELCRLSPEPITVSGLNHRLQKIIAVYERVRGVKT